MKPIRDMTKDELDEHLDALFNRICEDFGNKQLDNQMVCVLAEIEKREKKATVSSP